MLIDSLYGPQTATRKAAKTAASDLCLEVVVADERRPGDGLASRLPHHDLQVGDLPDGRGQLDPVLKHRKAEVWLRSKDVSAKHPASDKLYGAFEDSLDQQASDDGEPRQEASGSPTPENAPSAVDAAQRSPIAEDGRLHVIV